MSQKTKFKFSAGAVGAVAIGSFAIGVFAIGVLAIGRLFVRRFAVQKGSLASLEIGELTVRRLKVKELQVEDNLKLPVGQSRELQEPAEARARHDRRCRYGSGVERVNCGGPEEKIKPEILLRRVALRHRGTQARRWGNAETRRGTPSRAVEPQGSAQLYAKLTEKPLS
jgi:hypothetical protein